MDVATQEAHESKPKVVPRRSFITAMFAISGTVVGAVLVVPLIRFITYPLRRNATDTSWSDLGPVADFASLTAPVSKTITLKRIDAWETTSSQTAVYVLPPTNGQFNILSTICPHLGCGVRWVDTQDEFVCPCHGGKFTATGKFISGPPPRSMDKLESRVQSGVLQVRYQYFRQDVRNKEVVA
jgi:menaquinol-cytochrome c reductase iron-sulfur subunit